MNLPFLPLILCYRIRIAASFFQLVLSSGFIFVQSHYNGEAKLDRLNKIMRVLGNKVPRNFEFNLL